ncbi:M20 family metallopeptidase [Eubacteriales bacterium OttesenSCG-928-K08]|nr:M20 family metallopeptidase [Eubacteriales bacterium OttesenSCG-928-K08]
MDRLLELSAKHGAQMIADRRYIHQNAELSNLEFKTCAYVKEQLDQIGIQADAMAGTGLQGMIWGKNPKGKTIMLRADMDALPIKETTGLPFASQNEGAMHACGHDAHTAALLGAARILYEMRDQLNGNVKLCFQPGEEGGGGAERMIKDGIMENPSVDYAVATHMDARFVVGQAAIKPGVISSYPNAFLFKIRGKGGHGARPHMSLDPIAPAVMIYSFLEGLRKRIPPEESCIIQVCKFQAGSSFNITPDTAELAGTTRTVSLKTKEFVQAKMEEIASLVVALYGVECEVTFSGKTAPAPVVNTLEYVAPAKRSAAKVFTEGYGSYESVTGAEDFSAYGRYVPTTLIRVGCKGDDPSTHFMVHNSNFTIDERAVVNAAAAMASIAVDYLSGDFILDKMEEQ